MALGTMFECGCGPTVKFWQLYRSICKYFGTRHRVNGYIAVEILEENFLPAFRVQVAKEMCCSSTTCIVQFLYNKLHTHNSIFNLTIQYLTPISAQVLVNCMWKCIVNTCALLVWTINLFINSRMWILLISHLHCYHYSFVWSNRPFYDLTWNRQGPQFVQ